ncbi:MAG: trypsin-like peptidase domain-containing protein [Actinomycetota bacterium]|nr:trypsin-like peptidase domain-containing protein [Actinomycetota bacterium]
MGRAVGAVVVLVVTFVAGFLLGRTSAPETEEASVPTTADEQVSVSVPPGTEGQPSAPGSSSSLPAIPPPELDRDLEPVAAVAEAVAPAVVQIETSLGLGSGFVYDPAGLILTAAHVVQGGGELVEVRLADGRLFQGRVLGTNVGTDVAVVEIDPVDDLPVASLAVGEDLVVGQLAVAIGSPFGLDQTVTSGIVSAIDRPVPIANGYVQPMVQTDAAINTGNSGGALADIEGRVIGINDSIRTSSGGNQGIGFAIPIDIAVDVAEAIVSGEEYRPGYLGVSLADNTSNEPGALVATVEPGTAADAAGLEPGDRIVAVNGRAIRGRSELQAAIRSNQPGTEVELDIARGDDAVTLTATLGTP